MKLNEVSEQEIRNCADELRREINVRLRIYGRWIDEGKLTISTAKSQLESMELALAILQENKRYPAGYEPQDRTIRKETALPWRREA